MANESKIILINIKSCSDCPYLESRADKFGLSIRYYCAKEKGFYPRFIGSFIEREKTPDWCPI